MDIKNIEIKDELEAVMYEYWFGRLGNDETLEKINKLYTKTISDNHIKAMKHMGKLSLKMETITDQVKKAIIEHKQINIHSPRISAHEASYNVGAVEALEKVLENLKKDCKDFA
jgi:hypothetical protein